jgi:hypothetical protein
MHAIEAPGGFYAFPVSGKGAAAENASPDRNTIDIDHLGDERKSFNHPVDLSELIDSLAALAGDRDYRQGVPGRHCNGSATTGRTIRASDAGVRQPGGGICMNGSAKRLAGLVRNSVLAAAVALVMVLPFGGAAGAGPPSMTPRQHVLTSGLLGSVGSTIGPDGALYVTEGVAGRVSRVDRRTGRTSTYAEGLPRRVLAGVGGAMDVAFLRGTAYVLVTLVSPDVGGTGVDGIYRVDGPHAFTVVANIGRWSVDHPPVPPFTIATGVQYALQPYGSGFLVTDGHHNRVLRVGLDGTISEAYAFANVVPTGLATRGRTVIVAQAGPVPHLPADGKLVALSIRDHRAREVASGAPLLVDVEFGPHRLLYALSQGRFTPGHPEGSPADPDTGGLYRAGKGGTLALVAAGLDQPTSLEISGDTAYVVTLGGTVVVVASIGRSPHGH